MKFWAVLMALLLFSSSTMAQVCRVGCPCGNTCISCADTCRVGGGDARSDNPSSTQNNQTTILVVMGVLGAITCLGLVAALPLMMMSPSDSMAMFAPPKTAAAPYDSSNAVEHVRMMLATKCRDVEVERVDHDTVVGQGCNTRWTCDETNESWSCDEVKHAPPAGPKRTEPRLTNDDFN